MLDPKEPLWLPPGSVRAIIAILLTVAFVLVVLRSSIVIEAKDLVTIVTLVVGFYFISQVARAVRRGNGD
jgi:hypothetical protein